MHRVWAGHGSAQERPPKAPPSHHGCSLPQGISEFPMSSSPDRSRSGRRNHTRKGRSSKSIKPQQLPLGHSRKAQITQGLPAAKMAEDMVPTVTDLAEVYGLQGASQHQGGKTNRRWLGV